MSRATLPSSTAPRERQDYPFCNRFGLCPYDVRARGGQGVGTKLGQRRNATRLTAKTNLLSPTTAAT
jgi:hypothetical protein